MHRFQLSEFELRSGVMSPIEMIRSATTTAAELLREDDIGRIAPGCRADFLVLSKDPREPGILPELERHILMVVKGGAICVDRR
jgi:imidazolonepropionase-like amidohydrolase